MEFLAQNWPSLLVGAAILAAAALAVAKLIRDKKKGRSACGCNCKDCPGHCHKPQ